MTAWGLQAQSNLKVSTIFSAASKLRLVKAVFRFFSKGLRKNVSVIHTCVCFPDLSMSRALHFILPLSPAGSSVHVIPTLLPSHTHLTFPGIGYTTHLHLLNPLISSEEIHSCWRGLNILDSTRSIEDCMSALTMLCHIIYF